MRQNHHPQVRAIFTMLVLLFEPSFFPDEAWPPGRSAAGKDHSVYPSGGHFSIFFYQLNLGTYYSNIYL